MPNRLNRGIRRITSFAALLILFAQATVVADPGTKAPVAEPPAGRGRKGTTSAETTPKR